MGVCVLPRGWRRRAAGLQRKHNHYVARNATIIIATLTAILNSSTQKNREAEEAELARLGPAARAAYEAEAARLRAEAARARREAAEQALASAGTGAAGAAPRVVIDCSYVTESEARHAPRAGARAAEVASEAAARSLAKQIEIAMAFNRRSDAPLALTLTSYHGAFAAFCERVGAAKWPVARERRHFLEALAAAAPAAAAAAESSDGSSGGGEGCVNSGSSGEASGGSGEGGASGASSSTAAAADAARARVVVLSPDAPEALAGPLDPSLTYVIGGIVDRSVVKGLSLGFADAAGLRAARLPVREAAAALGLDFPGARKTPVLAVSDVVAALAVAHRTGGDWAAALEAALPARARREGGRRRRGREQAQQGAAGAGAESEAGAAVEAGAESEAGAAMEAGAAEAAAAEAGARQDAGAAAAAG